ncbi:MAG: 2,3,4,5-tetrahydropyridine-2,6-dicarboxylate N-succinyltransferase [Spongiibacteraceae bacterium]|nr:2,3,4,5-tetrahydropyridine-2,6-dicarboxylate N-succinyltransferase [Spongiibacteraceae bacterium]
MTSSLFSVGIGVGTHNSKGEWLEVFYPAPLLQPSAEVTGVLVDALAFTGGNHAINLDPARMIALSEALKGVDDEQASICAKLSSSKQPLVATVLSTDEAPTSVPEVYLKLHLLSHRLAKPHSLKLDGMFGVLPNVAWTNQGAVAIDELSDRQLEARLKGELLEVMSVDKFPKMANYVVPAGVRVAHTARVRLGAYLGEGTTIMHEGFVNFNAGTEGPGMVEGRISAGVVLGSGSDLGGGASTMGTLSGGNNVIISVGKECLIGANAGVGIPLGDRCTIEAGLYVTAGSLVTMLDDKGQVVNTVKARDLAGQSDLLFRRNSKSGAIEVLTNKSAIELNEALHAHN